MRQDSQHSLKKSTTYERLPRVSLPRSKAKEMAFSHKMKLSKFLSGSTEASQTSANPLLSSPANSKASVAGNYSQSDIEDLVASISFRFEKKRSCPRKKRRPKQKEPPSMTQKFFVKSYLTSDSISSRSQVCEELINLKSFPDFAKL